MMSAFFALSDHKVNSNNGDLVITQMLMTCITSESRKGRNIPLLLLCLSIALNAGYIPSTITSLRLRAIRPNSQSKPSSHQNDSKIKHTDPGCLRANHKLA